MILERVPIRQHFGAVASVLAILGAVIGSLFTRSEIGHVNQSIESIVSVSGTWLGELATALPLGYAFGAGMVAAVNPCGFALLPAYVALYLGTKEGPGNSQPDILRHLGQALYVSLIMTVGFVLIFGSTGAVLSVAAASIARYLPWVGLAIGVLLVAVGGRMLGGGTLYAGVGERLADRLGADTRQRNSGGYFAYGLAYALASLSCTLPIFLAVLGSALTSSGFLAASLQFILYALGMGLVIALLTSSTAFVRYTAITRVRNLVRYVQPACALLMLAAGAYVVYYWLTLGGLLAVMGLA